MGSFESDQQKCHMRFSGALDSAFFRIFDEMDNVECSDLPYIPGFAVHGLGRKENKSFFYS